MRNLLYIFPIRLVIMHIKHNITTLLMWFFFIGMITGYIGKRIGLQYLFLDPEYCGEVNFLSFFIVGVTLGVFMMSWNMATYLLNSTRFPFLATFRRPFIRYCANNFIIPALFLLYYTYTIFQFQWKNEFTSPYAFLGVVVGVITVVLSIILYFFLISRDIDMLGMLKEILPPNFNIAPPNIKANIEERKEEFLSDPYDDAMRVDTYLTGRFRVRRVRDVQHYDRTKLIRVFNQNHRAAFYMQVIILLIFFLLGYLIDYQSFRIPAGASIFLVFTLLINFLGALTYWFQAWTGFIIILGLITINLLTKNDFLKNENQAYGLNYDLEKPEYSYQKFAELNSKENQAIDKAATLKILKNWKQKNISPTNNKPKLVIIGASGGGSRASVWTTHVLQQCDATLQGKLLNQTALMTGASGGMLGAAYIRELYLQKQLGNINSIYERQYTDNIGKDILNAIAVTIVVNDVFLPWVNFDYKGQKYRKDRGYIFEKQLIENTGNILDKNIGAYKKVEQTAQIPMLFLTPVIVNDARRLLISPQGTAYMNEPFFIEKDRKRFHVEQDILEFHRMFEDADSIRFTTALRMNATFPFILPAVTLPSTPSIHIMDAGFRDNIGISAGARFCHVFKDWINENTSGVVFLQIRGGQKWEDIESNQKQGNIERALEPISITGKVGQLQDFHQDAEISYLNDILDNQLEVIHFIYRPNKNREKAAMSLHLTEQEKRDILNSFLQPHNQRSLNKLKLLLE